MEKQRAILLIKYVFNFSNKLYFGSRMINWATGIGTVPLEHHGLQDRNCLEVVTKNTFFNNKMIQKHWVAAK